MIQLVKRMLLAVAITMPLFHHGHEVFRIVDKNSKTPVFHVLKGTDLHFEKIFFRPLKADHQEIAIALQVSGQEFYIEPTIKRADLAAGKLIHVNVPSKTDELALLSVTSEGHFDLKYNRNNEELLIDRAVVKFKIENSMSKTKSEQIKFSGKGIRE